MTEPVLYVMEVGDRIKVGRTSNPAQRMGQHRSNARFYGAGSGREWVSSPGVGTENAEAELLGRCAERASERVGREWFSGLRFDDAVAFAQALESSPVQDRRMTRSNAARYLGVGASTVDRLVARHGLSRQPTRHELDRYVTESGHSE